MLQHHARHVDGALVMRDHAEDEIDIGIAGIGNVHVGMHAGIGILVAGRRGAVGRRHGAVAGMVLRHGRRGEAGEQDGCDHQGFH
ncbi:hypothetical protein D3C72_1858800 [compost metagenome]